MYNFSRINCFINLVFYYVNSSRNELRDCIHEITKKEFKNRRIDNNEQTISRARAFDKSNCSTGFGYFRVVIFEFIQHRFCNFGASVHAIQY